MIMIGAEPYRVYGNPIPKIVDLGNWKLSDVFTVLTGGGGGGGYKEKREIQALVGFSIWM